MITDFCQTSNADVWHEGILYPSTDYAYQLKQRLLMKKLEKNFEFNFVLSKNKGQEIGLRSNWESIKYDVMFACCFDKFFRHQDLRELLLSTGNKYLEKPTTGEMNIMSM